MKMKKCVYCGTEYKSNGRKNEKPHCGSDDCKKEHKQKLKIARQDILEIPAELDNAISNISAKRDVISELKEELSQAKREKKELEKQLKEQESFLLPAIEDIENRYSEDIAMNKELCDALLTINKYISRIDGKELEVWKEKLSRCHMVDIDLKHMIELGKIKTPSGVNAWAEEYRDLCIQRRVAKTRVAIYEALKCIEGFDNIDFKEIRRNDNSKYSPRIYDIEPFGKGDEIDVVNLKYKDLSDTTISYSTEYDEYVADINLSHITSKYVAHRVCFIDGNLNGLKNKIQQQSSKYSKFRVKKGLIECYN